MTTRYFRHETGWLARVDGNPQASMRDSVAHCEAEYGLAGVAAEDSAGRDPRSGTLVYPPAVVRAPDIVEALTDAITAATTLEELKRALLGAGTGAAVAARHV